MKKAINIADAPKPVAPYSQACLVNGILYVSGQIPVDPYSGDVLKGSASEQTKLILDNIGRILKEVDMDYTDVVKCTIFMSDINLYKDINEVYGTYFKQDPPAREAIEVSAIPLGVDVKISCIAAK